MADSRTSRGSAKRDRLVAAAVRTFHEQGVEKTRLADIAEAAGVPLGNVYYYFKTKDQLVEAALGSHAGALAAHLAALDALPAPADRLKALVQGWIDQSDVAARFGCPTGTLASELDKRTDGLDRAAADTMRPLLDWLESQFRALGRPDDARDLAVALLSAYQGASLLTNTFRDPALLETEGRRLQSWIDTLARPTPPGA
ncbi:TetR/AcrR family transcriptional regulator [Actinomadura parmotrematis]|uniref:TetR/AcrR family transcriptional regulator n=1 Tax=Actinomadura parmotrematis TaxID=2864039 RepID=A0ABS7FVW3_9ACTN|nr:TetR/AcrR family transcriptional regulator [Actinomadura parmotrematis]MBW8484567.1 TetR/AcrR family transcriptional regulator [Actinomadura parmotrematis]